MKKRTLFACGLAAALFAGCSSDDVTVDNGTVSNGGSGFLALNISLPSTTGGSRANGATDQTNDKYHDGDADEYAINKVHLICYTSAGDAVQAFEYTPGSEDGNFVPSGETGITTSAMLKVQPVKSNVSKVLVLVNAASAGLSIDGATGTITYGGVQYTKCDANGTIKDGSDNPLVITNQDLTGGGDKFFMSNSPLSNGTNTTVLVDVAPKTTEAAAQADFRTVNVERAVGKVTMVHAADHWSNWVYTNQAAGYIGDEITFDKWLVDISNKSTYPVRYYDKAWETLAGTVTQRFFGALSYVGNNKASAGRTYWAKDPNYDGTYTYDANDFNIKQVSDFTALTSNMDDAQYCMENTFDVQRMQQRHTTRVLLQATYKPNSSTGSGSCDADGTWYRLGNSNKAYTTTEVNNLIKACSGCASVSLAADLSSCAAKDFSATLLQGLDSDPTTQANQIDAIKNTLGKLTVFSKGLCYYVVRIKHFGETYTPWTSGDYVDNYGGLTNPDYSFLGRYGIVRNNWYELEVSTISAPGEPEITSPSTKADDETNHYIQANVKIMDWAVRKQSVNL